MPVSGIAASATPTAGLSTTSLCASASAPPLLPAASLATASAAAPTALFDLGGFEARAVFLHERIVMPFMCGIAWDGCLDDLFDLAKEINFVFCAKGDGESGGSGATGAADTVDIGFRFVGKIVVHDEADIFHIHSACCYIGGNEYGDDACLELSESFFALRLRFVSMDSFCFETSFAECLSEFVRTVLGTPENDGELCLFCVALFFKKLLEEIHFIAAVDEA